jgi:serine/threonine protein kinase
MATKTRKDLGEVISEHNHKTVYVKDGVITKVFDHKFYDGSFAFKEAMYQQYAYECKIYVPQVYGVFQVGEDWAISSQEIKGKTLAQMMAEDPEHKKKYVVELVKIHIQLLSRLSSNLMLPKLKDKLNSYISDSGLSSSTRYDLHVKLEKMPNHYKFCHGDFFPQNVIFDETGKYYILNWAHVTRGNASADASMTYLLFLLNGDEKAANTYLREFCKKTYTNESYVQQWISVCSAAKLKSVSDEAQKKLLLDNIDVVEY